MKKTTCSLICSVAGLWFATATDGQADGYFLQIDLASETSDVVVATTRGTFSYGANYSSYEGGWSLGASVTRDFAIENFGTVKIGPSIGTTDERDDFAVGAKLVLERYVPTNFGFVFLLGQYNTIDDDFFTLAQIGNGKGISVDLSAGKSDTYSEQSIAVNYLLGDSPVSLRGGYRFKAREIFLGVSLNTF
ncbi:hypothetical protein ABMC89_04400 [Sulfitobacter sp. HNIBRBA3233]|uniref:hypothetical protein n=1 Tax=Sulfitobacter marinivivus TaxID=3158558 RepID=UPI0032DE4BEA